MSRGRKDAAFSRVLAGEPSDEGGDLPDLVEEDVWSVMYGREAAEPASRREHPQHRRRISRGRSVGGLSLAFDGEGYDAVDGSPMARVLHQCHDVASTGFGDGGHGRRRRGDDGHVVASSAPMDVPAWPQALRDGPDAVEVEVEEGEAWMPPHEYIQRREMASGGGGSSSGRVATSVLEGAGRTLKGRDMSRVRDAVWRQTGFFG